MTASALSFRLAVLFVITGMGMGIWMAGSGDHSVAPAHAHLNLLGWVSLFLFGLFYERRPALDRSRIAFVQIGIWSVGTILLTVAVAAIYLGYPAADPLAAFGSFVVVAAMLLFGYLVFRRSTSAAASPGLRMEPAE